MDEQKRCPVCGTEIPADADTCPECGMDDLNRIFLDRESYERWVETKLKPYASRYRYNKAVEVVPAGGSQEEVFPLKYDPYSRVRPVIAAAGDSTFGLKKDGTVVAIRFNGNGQCSVSAWHDIVAIAAGGGHTVGLKKNGTVVMVAANTYDPYSVSAWHDIVAITAGYHHTIGLKKDGTVVAAGSNDFGRWMSWELF